MVAIRFEIAGETRFDNGVWPAWWNKELIAIDYEGVISAPNAVDPQTVAAVKIYCAPKGAK